MSIADRIFNDLSALHALPVCELNYKTPFQLLVAVILSAQCTDARVNKITPALFERADNPYDMAKLEQEELEELIKSCGFYHNKAKNILSASKTLCEKFGGVVPSTVEELMTLDGVGKKTANVVYAVAFGGNAIAVDTHVFRVSHRLGLTEAKDPLGVEKDLCKIFKEEQWSTLHHLLIHHGRYICKARKPECERCTLGDICKEKRYE